MLVLLIEVSLLLLHLIKRKSRSELTTAHGKFLSMCDQGRTNVKKLAGVPTLHHS